MQNLKQTENFKDQTRKTISYDNQKGSTDNKSGIGKQTKDNNHEKEIENKSGICSKPLTAPEKKVSEIKEDLKLPLKKLEEKDKTTKKPRPVTAPILSNRSTESEKGKKKKRPKTAPPPDKKVRQFNSVILFIFTISNLIQIPMDPMRALASLEFVSARGLETSDYGPKILANQVRFSIERRTAS